MELTEKAKEKAEQLIEKFAPKMPNENWKDKAIECAIIVVDEIENVGCWVSIECAKSNTFPLESTEEFWQQVRIELINY